MRGRLIIATAMAATFVAGTLATSAPAAPRYEAVTTQHIVKTKHGDIFVEVSRPTLNGKDVKAPVVFTYSPYSALNADRTSDRDEWVADGYVRAVADVVGTGNSGGCYDYGGTGERETGAAVVEWLAKQKWSTGKVGMFGSSYEGSTATATAVERPKGLVTIVPEAAVSRWYGYSYSGGIRYLFNNENPTDEPGSKPLTFDFGLAVPPPADPQNADWAERVRSSITPCEELSHTEHGYDETPDYDKFWVERDYLRDADEITIPVLVAHNWGDWDVKQEEGWNLFQALDNSRKRVLYFGSRYDQHGIPGGGYEKFRHEWMDRWLKGEDNGIEKSPTYITQTADSKKAGGWTKTNNIKTTNVDLFAQEVAASRAGVYRWKLMPTKPRLGPQTTPSQFPSTNINTEAHMNHHAESNHDWAYFESPPLKKDVRLFGAPKLQVKLQTTREWLTVTPTIIDLDPACHQNVPQVGHVTNPTCLSPGSYTAGINSVTRGWLDTRYRNGLSEAKAQPLNPGLGMTVVHKPTDYVFKKGHHIGLQVATELNEWMIPKAYPCTDQSCVNVRVLWERGETKLTLPLVGDLSARKIFDAHAHH